MTYSDEYYNNISFLLKKYVPDFIVDDYPLFYEFIETYYEWAQQNDRFVPWTIVKNIRNWSDIDSTIDEFTDYFAKEYINLPGIENKSIYIKHLKEILQSKGSSKTIEFFINLLTGQNVSIYYPNRYLMKSSDAEWKQYKYIYLNIVSGIDYSKYISTIVTGLRSEVTGIVEGIELFSDHILVKLSSVNGVFLIGEEIRFKTEDEEFITTIYNTISGFNIDKPGNNYLIGDRISISEKSDFFAYVSDIYSGGITNLELISGGSNYEYGDILIFETADTDDYYSNPVARVSAVDANGTITKLEIVYRGYGLKSIPILSDVITTNGTGIIVSAHSDEIGGIKRIDITDSSYNFDTTTLSINSDYGVDAELTPIISSIYNKNASYIKNGSFLSNIYMLQDSYYWQEYSYVLNIASNLLTEFSNVFKQILHPAGFIYFTNIDFENYVSTDLSLEYINSELNVYDFIEKELSNYVELIAFSDRIIDESVLQSIYNKEISSLSAKKLNTFIRSGGSFINSELRIANESDDD